jgi:hypothetical protein
VAYANTVERCSLSLTPVGHEANGVDAVAWIGDVMMTMLML